MAKILFSLVTVPSPLYSNLLFHQVDDLFNEILLHTFADFLYVIN